MIAQYATHCNYCDVEIQPGDEMVRAHARKAGGKWAHATCKPAASAHSAAGWRVAVSESTNRNVPVGLTKQFVHESKARAYAADLEAFGGVTCTVSEI